MEAGAKKAAEDAVEAAEKAEKAEKDNVLLSALALDAAVRIQTEFMERGWYVRAEHLDVFIRACWQIHLDSCRSSRHRTGHVPPGCLPQARSTLVEQDRGRGLFLSTR